MCVHFFKETLIEARRSHHGNKYMIGNELFIFAQKLVCFFFIFQLTGMSRYETRKRSSKNLSDGLVRCQN